MTTNEFVKTLDNEIANLKIRMEELKMMDNPLVERIWCKAKINKAISELADASMIICGLYPDNDTSF